MRASAALRGAQLRAATQGLFCPEAEAQWCAQGGSAPRVSVICPTTEERLLFHAQLYGCFAASLLEPRELVVVDTGLSGPSPVLSRLAEEDRRIVYRHFRVPSHSWPVGLKRNIAVHLAAGEAIAHFDDDDLYAPEYLSEMLEAMEGSDAITLSSWFVFDTCTGIFAHVDPFASTIYNDEWAYGYGFSYLYRRDACLEVPFPDVLYFAEDTHFLKDIQRDGRRKVWLRRDDAGLVLHMQHGGNLSNSHAHREVALDEMQCTPLARAPGFSWYVTTFTRRLHESPYTTLGAACITHLRPSEHRDPTCLQQELHSLGVPARQRASALSPLWAGVQEALAAASCSTAWRAECVVEPGRLFEPVQRYPDNAVLPGDVPRVQKVERLALLHVARLLLRRAGGGPHVGCSGEVRLSLRALSSISVIPLCGLFLRHFPALRLEVDFDVGMTFLDELRLHGCLADCEADVGSMLDCRDARRLPGPGLTSGPSASADCLLGHAWEEVD